MPCQAWAGRGMWIATWRRMALLMNEVAWVRCPGSRLDSAGARAVSEDAKTAFAAGARDLVIDLSHVVAIDSEGVAGLADVARRAGAGARLALAALQPSAEAIAHLTRLDELFMLFDTIQAAQAALED